MTVVGWLASVVLGAVFLQLWLRKGGASVVSAFVAHCLVVH